VGVDPARLQAWAANHQAWLHEQLTLAHNAAEPHRLSSADRALAEAVFRSGLPEAFCA